MHIKNLSFKHHQEVSFFEDLNFTLEQGKIHALHGKNGTGKTVLLHILSGKIPSQGTIDGKEKAFLVDQRFDEMLAPQFSFADNLKFARINHFPCFFSRLKDPIPFSHILEKFHINYSTHVNKLSGGQRQILALLMILQRKVDILLLDEPTAALDEHNARMVFEFLKTLADQGMTILAVCHDKELMDEYTTGKKLHLTRQSSGIRELQVF